MTEENSLGPKEKRDLTIQAGLQAIPYVGGSLATLYFGAKEEARFKRLESFYKELAEELKHLKSKIPPVEQHDAKKLEAILEDLNDKVESEATAEKRRYFKNYFKSTLNQPIGSDYDERKTFLKVLDDLSLLECELLSAITVQDTPVKVSGIQKPGVEQYAIVGAIGKLRTCGFLGVKNNSIIIGGKSHFFKQSNKYVRHAFFAGDGSLITMGGVHRWRGHDSQNRRRSRAFCRAVA